MAQDSGLCPHCGKAITPRPRRARRCPHCGGQVHVRGGELVAELTRPAGSSPLSPPPPARAEELHAVVAEVLRQLGAGRDVAERFARCQSFGSELTPRETAFAQATAFATEIGPGRVISISHAEDQRGTIVTVWYWAPPYEVESDGP